MYLKMTILSIFLLDLIFNFSYASETSANQHQIENDLQEYISNTMNDWSIPGMALGIIKDNKVILSKGYGVREIKNSEPVDENTVFPIASLTKSFTAGLMGMLVDEGKVAWDDLIVKHMPNFRLYDPNLTNQITIRDILCHRTGLERAEHLWLLTAYNQHEVLNQIQFLKPKWSLRSRFSYSNIFYSIAGLLEESITGHPWSILINEKIFKPLGMTSSFTSLNNLNEVPNSAKLYTLTNDQLCPVDYPDFDNCNAAISICSNVTDLLKWVDNQMNWKVFNQNQILSGESLAEMHRPQMIVNDPSWNDYYPDSSFVTYGFGWVVYDYKGRKIIEHIGSTAKGVTSLIAMVPKENLGIVILINKDSWAMFPSTICRRIFDHFFDQTKFDWNNKFLKTYNKILEDISVQEKKTNENRLNHTTPSLPLEDYAGTYEDALYGQINVDFTSDGLNFNSKTLNGKLEHWHFDTFRLLPRKEFSVADKFFVVFTFNSNGKVDGMKVNTPEGTNFVKLNL